MLRSLFTKPNNCNGDAGGWEDLKDCFSGTLGLSRGHQGSSSTRSSRQRVYGGDHYVNPHHLGSRDGFFEFYKALQFFHSLFRYGALPRNPMNGWVWHDFFILEKSEKISEKFKKV